MKQKYLIFKNPEKNELIIREFAELDKERFSLLCEEAYDDEMIEAAIEEGVNTLISKLRTQNMYPIGHYVKKIAESIATMYVSGDKQSVELFFNDNDLLIKNQEPDKDVGAPADESSDLDELLDEDVDNDYANKNELEKFQSPVKIADGDSTEID
ncbi:MAG: hypothetical protein V3V39_08700, partial [Desulfobacterales bacterium]